MSQSFKEILINAIENKGVNLSKLSELSRVPERYLELLIRGEFNNLPSAPYIHGYLTHISHILDVEDELLWEAFKKENFIKTSGASDELPKNRFSIQTVSNTKTFAIGGFAVLALVYFIFRFNSLFGKPELTVTTPKEEIITVSSSVFFIKGSTDKDAKLTINDEMINMDENNNFSKSVLLQGGINSFEIKAKKFLGRETSVTRQIIYQEPEVSPIKEETSL
ncbi:MAG: hypothetical protein A2430_00730 [Candidatus Liptonbacteria bacterium RIFOXYC1_FULL_36_8]|uniref:HTH cro/C1-type domain-containing protein n=3 Tax=Candidatus Liptoniibacteriota TaxID=1817909 RepID=A0A1G2CM40_9BACT|nr:MAG: hypothetical protein A2390_02910 [Candidatus Liptonbacteria bacterium RIFOXYB1_FULL_36_10]OGZ02973.1 MAG: hypothetical protein A2430_00730 [Candidatus Liptonbacteria bacterium RIFOXYC1_FULL_36_8]OGZ04620.1 MAG: hypothetical protein A2604_00375 [Candidatus Liptonbacteria bacterium RIFOXYD1_FULL_36_11]